MAVPNEHDELETLTVHTAGNSGTPAGQTLGELPVSVRERITLRGLHSAGGTGEVWRAYDEVIGREVALKRLQSGQNVSDSLRARFTREAKLTGQLEHPGIVPVYEYGNDERGRQCYYTMRFVRGRTLREVIRHFHEQRRQQQRSLLGGEFMQLLHHFVNICHTMAFAHSRGIIHRDLKGDNVIIGDFGEALILDWGLAKQVDAPADEPAGESEPNVTNDVPLGTALETMQGELLGTPAYMAPEQAHGHIDRIDRRTDVYGLAAILYEILTGRPPFLGRIEQVIRAVLEDEPRPPSELVVDVPPELAAICLRGLAKDMDCRPQSVEELGNAVEHWLLALAERKRTEQERERFFNLSLDLLAIIDHRGHLAQCNAAWQSTLGWSPEQLCDAPLFSRVLAADVELARTKLDELHGGLASLGVELRMATADGGYRWIDWSIRRLPDDVGAYLVGRDVTERKQAEQEVEGLIESAPDAMAVIDETGVLVRVNTQLERMFGYPRAQLLGQPIEVLVPEQLRGRHVAHVQRYVASPRARPMGSGMSLIGQRADGSSFPVEISLSPVHTERRLLISCTMRDLGERRKLERTMMAILEAAPDAMITVDGAQTIRLVNHQTEQLFGWARHDLLGQPLALLIPEASRAAHADHVRRYIADPSPRSMGAGRVLAARHHDGHEFPIAVSLSPVETDEGLLISCAIRRFTPNSG